MIHFRFVDLVDQSPLVTENLDITFRFDRLSIGRRGRVLKANLKAAADADELALKRIKEYQSQLRKDFEKKFGVKDHKFDPHISLGYFSNYDVSNDAKFKVDQWSEEFGNSFETCTITYKTAYFIWISRYGEFLQACLALLNSDVLSPNA